MKAFCKKNEGNLQPRACGVRVEYPVGNCVEYYVDVLISVSGLACAARRCGYMLRAEGGTAFFVRP